MLAFHRKAAAPRARLRIEVLEDRCVPATLFAQAADPFSLAVIKFRHYPGVAGPAETQTPGLVQFVGDQAFLSRLAAKFESLPGVSTALQPTAALAGVAASGGVMAAFDVAALFRPAELAINQGEIPADVFAAIKADPTWDVDQDGVLSLGDLNDVRNQGPGEAVDFDADGLITPIDLLQTREKGGWQDGTDGDGNGAIDDVIA